MEVTTAYLREFVRKVFRDHKNNAQPIEDILDALADAAVDSANASKGSGRILTSTSDGQGNSATWTMLSKAGGQDEQLNLIDAARNVIGDKTDVDAVLEQLKPIRRVGVNFSHYQQ